MRQTPSMISLSTSESTTNVFTVQSTLQSGRKGSNSIAIRELILYGLCLVIICAISFGWTNDSTYYFTHMLSKAFVTAKTNGSESFNDIAQNNGGDFWKALQGPIFSRLYNVHDGEHNAPKANYGYVLNENKILGVARLRQVRVKPNSCKLHEEFVKRNFTQACYAAYTIDQEDQSAFGDDLSHIFTHNAWTYTSANATRTSVSKGMVSEYSGGGYVQLLTRNAYRTMEILKELERNSWIDRGTRAVFLDVLVYNPNINLFCHIRLLAEYPSSGGAIPSTSIRAVKLIQYTSAVDYVTLVCELIFALVIILQIIECLIEMIKQKHWFFLNLWNLISLLAIILSSICVLYQLLVYFATRKHLGGLLQIEDHYPDFHELFTLTNNSDFYLGLTLGFTWLKIFKYLNLNKTMLLLNKTISSSLNEIFAFTCIFSIIFLAYTQFGWLFFGRYLTDWRTFPGSIFSLFRMIIGDFDFYAMLNIGEIVGPLFLFTYIYFVYFVLLNMFLAIINDTYARIVTDKTLQTFQIRGFPGWFGKRKPAALQANLRKRGYTDDDIKQIIHTYDTNRDGSLNKNERKVMKEDLEKGQIKIDQNLDGNTTDIDRKLPYKEYLELNEQVNNIENEIVTYVDKIEEILGNLDDLHRTMIDRQQILANISIRRHVKNER